VVEFSSATVVYFCSALDKVPAMPSISDADLAASLTALLHRWHPATD